MLPSHNVKIKYGQVGKNEAGIVSYVTGTLQYFKLPGKSRLPYILHMINLHQRTFEGIIYNAHLGRGYNIYKITEEPTSSLFSLQFYFDSLHY